MLCRCLAFRLRIVCESCKPASHLPVRRKVSLLNYKTKTALWSTVAAVTLSSNIIACVGDPAAKNEGPMLTAVLDPPDLNKSLDNGVFVDSAGSKHPWKVSSHHTLSWDSRQYIPVGGRFVPLEWTQGDSPQNFAGDCKMMDALKTGGVHDIYFSSGNVGLFHVPASVVQKVLDYADQDGLKYGLQIDSFPKGTLGGIVVKPSTNKALSPSGAAVFDHVGHGKKAYYVIITSQDQEIVESGYVPIINGTASVKDSFSDDNIVLLYPENVFGPTSPESHLPDIWANFDSYRDSSLDYLTRLKYGPGFRYFLDPIATDLDLAGDADVVIPTSAGFRLDFETWLRQKYGNSINDLVSAWGNLDEDIPDFKTAARLFPLWSDGRGVPFLADPITQTRYAIMNHPGIRNTFWTDFREFRFGSFSKYNSSLASILKSTIAQVPIVIRTRGRGPVLVGSGSTSIDGLMVIQNATGSSEPANSEAFARSEQTSTPLWLTVDSDFANISNSGVQPQESDWDAAKTIGMRGFYCGTFNADPSAVTAAPTPDLSAYTQYKSEIANSMGTLDNDLGILWYPKEAAAEGVTSRQLKSGAWWLPSYRDGQVYQLGPYLKAYSATASDNQTPTYVVWSPNGDAGNVTFDFGKEKPIFLDGAGLPFVPKHKKELWTVNVSEDPIQISNVSTLALPTNVIELTITRIQDLLKDAARQKIPTETFVNQLFYAENHFDDKPSDLPIKYDLLRNIVRNLEATISPYVWIEGEAAKPTNFTSISNNPIASNGATLTLDTDAEPDVSADGYYAQYSFGTNSAGRYELWLAGTPLDGQKNSPLIYRVNESVPSEVTGQEGVSPYGGKFIWTKLGMVDLKLGQNVLTFRIARRAKSDNRYRMTIDAVCLSRVPFAPAGTQRPVIVPEHNKVTGH